MEEFNVSYDLNIYDHNKLFMNMTFPTYDEALAKYEAKHNLKEWKKYSFEIVVSMVVKRIVFKDGEKYED